MSRPTLVLREAEIRSLVDPSALIGAIEHAFTSYATGRAELPDVIHLDVPEARGEVHVKAGYLHGGTYWAVKIASGFPGNPALGLPANDGVVLVFDAATGALAAVLLDNGYLTDVRTAAAGAVAARHLARAEPCAVAVIGAGAQARLQVRMLAQVRSFEVLRVWGRRRDAAEAVIRDLAGELPPGVRAGVVDTPEAAVAGADVVYTTTASRAPLVRADWIGPGALVVAVGSDGADKQELDVDVLAMADRIVADSLAQCRRIGEIHHALDAGVIGESRVTELGRITGGLAPGRASMDERIVCDLTGLGVQDVAAAALVLERAEARGVGERWTR